MDVFVARQPIFDRDRRPAGYELLFRSSLENVFSGVDGSRATAEVIEHGFVLIGARALTEGQRAFINFPRELIVRDVPLLLPSSDVVVELLLGDEVDDELLAACARLTAAGYAIALDNYVGSELFEPLLEHASYVKIDVREDGLDEVRRSQPQVARHGVQVIAKCVEGDELHQQCLDAGCDLFQGFFFSRPEVLKVLSPRGGRSMNLLALVAELNQPEFDLKRAQKLIRTDVALSYKLLRYLNSAFFSLPREVSSIEQAVMLLGTRNVQRFVSIVFLTQLGTDKPDELMKTSILNARFCELLAPERAQEAFTLGLFSLLDAVVDAPMDEALDGLPLAGELRMALMSGTGPLGAYLRLAKAYQAADWDAVSDLARRLKLDESRLPGHYRESVGWADAMFDLDETP
jgi:c-di-GMP-related signal transduction protein